MKRLQNFLNKLRNAGYRVNTNWQQKVGNGTLEHATIIGKVGYIQVIFHIYGENEGFQIYHESPCDTFDDDIALIKGMVD